MSGGTHVIDGAVSDYFDQVRSYETTVTYARVTEQRVRRLQHIKERAAHLSPLELQCVLDPDDATHKTLDKLIAKESEWLASCKAQVVSVRKAIEDGFKPQFDHSTRQSKKRIDHGAKNKILKCLDDIDAGTYVRRDSYSQEKKAIYKALAFGAKKSRMPSHKELKDMGCNDQVATNVGIWYRALGCEDLFLHSEKVGRKRKTDGVRSTI